MKKDDCARNGGYIKKRVSVVLKKMNGHEEGGDEVRIIAKGAMMIG